MRKIILKAVNVISVVVIGIALLAMIKVVFTPSGEAPSFLGFSIFRISSGSMEPTIREDSLIVDRIVKPEDVEPGDVITFYSDDPSLLGFPNTHRVVEIIDDNGHIMYRTKGDANFVEDAYLCDSDKLIGEVVFVSVFLGKAMRLLSNPLIFIPVIALPLVFILISSIVDAVKIAKKISEEEDKDV